MAQDTIKKIDDRYSGDKIVKMLTKQAAEGYIFKKVKDDTMIFEKEEPQKLRYDVTYNRFRKGEKEEYLKKYEQNGWEYIASTEVMNIFANSNPNPLPLYKDAKIQYEALNETVHNKMKNDMKNFSVVTLIVVIMNLYQIITEPGKIILNPGLVSSSIAGILPFVLVVLLFTYLNYENWHKKAEKSANEENLLVTFPNSIIPLSVELSILFIIPLIAIFLHLSPIISITTGIYIGIAVSLYFSKKDRKTLILSVVFTVISTAVTVVAVGATGLTVFMDNRYMNIGEKEYHDQLPVSLESLGYAESDADFKTLYVQYNSPFVKTKHAIQMDKDNNYFAYYIIEMRGGEKIDEKIANVFHDVSTKEIDAEQFDAVKAWEKTNTKTYTVMFDNMIINLDYPNATLSQIKRIIKDLRHI